MIEEKSGERQRFHSWGSNSRFLSKAAERRNSAIEDKAADPTKLWRMNRNEHCLTKLTYTQL